MTTRSWLRSRSTRSVTRTIRNAPHRTRLGLEALEDRWVPSTFTVVNTLDDGSAGSLRWAVGQANATLGADTITFDNGVFSTPQTITLTNGQLELTDSATTSIQGPGAGLLSISGNGNGRVFAIDSGASAAISGLIITGGKGAFNGGGVSNAGTLAMTNDTISNNIAGGGGGGVSNLATGTLAMTNDTVIGNSIKYGGYSGGGGLDNAGTATLVGCTFTNNTSPDYGGGVENGGKATATLTNCTLSGNNCGTGGGLVNFGGPIALTNCTISANDFQAAYGNGAGVYFGSRTSTTLTNTIIDGNGNGFNVQDVAGYSGTVSGNNNLIGSGSEKVGLVNGSGGNLLDVTNPFLAPLGSYGGPTQTMPLLPGSPAIDAGASGTGVPTTDQRNEPRVGAVDIGAFESQGFTYAAVPGGTGQTANIGTAFANPLAVTVTPKLPGEPVDGAVIQFTANTAGNGATAIFLSPSAVIAGGVAAVTAAPNNVLGSYTVVAAVPGSSFSFALTNTGTVVSNLKVNTTSSSIAPGAGLLSLPEAIAFADTAPAGSQTITFDPNVFAAPQTIQLSGNQLELSHTTGTVTITGPAAGVTIDAGGKSRVLQVDAGVTAALSNLILTGGIAGTGAGVNNLGTTTLTSCTVSNNSHTYRGAGVFSASGTTLNLINCTLSGNSGNDGSGLYADHATVALTNCTISGNKANYGAGMDNVFGKATLTGCTVSGNIGGTTGIGNNGGGVANFGNTAVLALTNCTITGNSSPEGGGVFNNGTVTLTNCTVSGNSARHGGGLFNRGTATLTNCTIAGNTANANYYGGGGLSNYGAATLTNTIVAGNKTSAGGNTAGNINGGVSGNNNLIGTGNAGGLVNGVNGNIVGVVNPLLAPLGNYGGPTQTMPLLPGSLAIDAGASGTGIPATDERGLGRFGGIDIGAFESQGFTFAPVPGSTPQTANIGTAFARPLAGSVTANNPAEPVNGGVVRFAAHPAANGATAIFIDPSDVIANGQAAVVAAPNNVLGSYAVVAASLGSSASFALTNAGQVFAALSVNTTSDSLIPGAGLLSLREAIAFANTAPAGSQTITFDPTVFATPQTITLTGTQLELSYTSGTVTITGPTAGVTINAGGLSRVFQVDAGVTASLSKLTLTGGSASTGGGLSNQGTATLTSCTVNGNSSYYSGGGLLNTGTTTLSNCTVSGNSGVFFSYGGGVANYGTATLTACTVSSNSAFFGGGLSNGSGTATLTNCTIGSNSASSGGGLSNGSGTATLTNCTVSGNSATTGGGLDNGGTMSLTNCTVSGNSVAASGFYGTGGGGLANYGMLTMTGCTVSGNSASGNYYGGAGGGLLNRGTATMTGCTVSSNSTTGGQFSGSIGGGLANSGTLTLTGCTVSGNSATGNSYSVSRGGGLANNGTATLSNCTVSGNSANYGGGLFNYGSPYSNVTAALTNCTVTGNSASNGGGIANQGTLNVSSSKIQNNQATSQGGGISTTAGSMTITGSTINANKVISSDTAQGGGISCENSLLSLVNCTLNANQANGATTAMGGGIYAAASTVSVQSSNVNANQANGTTAEGGGIYVASTILNMANSTVNGNKANGTTLGEGGGIDSHSSTLTLTSCNVKGNKATTGYDDIFNGP